jgi:uncharacterized protein YbaA (DUF1428 family)
MAYVDGFVIPVPSGKKEDYRRIAAQAAPIFLDHGALHVVECWGDDIPKGKTTDFFMAVKGEEGENIVFSWIAWPSKEARDAGNKAAMEDPRMKEMGPDSMPFDGKRMIYAGFEPIVEQSREG